MRHGRCKITNESARLKLYTLRSTHFGGYDIGTQLDIDVPTIRRFGAARSTRPAATGQEQPFAEPLFDHPVGAQQDRRRNGEAEGVGGLQVDDKLELRGLLDGEVGGLGALENLVYVGRGAPK